LPVTFCRDFFGITAAELCGIQSGVRWMSPVNVYKFVQVQHRSAQADEGKPYASVLVVRREPRPFTLQKFGRQSLFLGRRLAI
jgi:hypothetical protein